MHALVDGANGVMNLHVARRQPQRRLRLVHGIVETAAGEQRAGDAVEAAGQLGRQRQRVAIAQLRLFKQTGRPESIAVERHRVGIPGRHLDEGFGFVPGEIEFGDAQRRLDDTSARAAKGKRVRRFQGVLKCLERFDVAALRIQKAAQLELDFSGLRRRYPVGMNREGRCHDKRRHNRGSSETELHEPSSEELAMRASIQEPRRPNSRVGIMHP